MVKRISRIDDYVSAVLEGKIPACELVQLACERHLNDLETGHKRGLHFDYEAVDHVVEFFENFLVHSKGEWAGKQFKLELWQAFILGSIFGWKNKDGTRRFRVAYNELPRKQGKSTLSAGIGLYLLVADNEPGAEVYSASTKREQSRITHGEAVRMVKASSYLKKLIGICKDNLSIEKTNSKYEPLGADADTMDGLNIHGAVIDELHAHKTRAVWDVIETATGARRQALIFTITTAGSDILSVCWEQHEYATKILKGVIEDDTYFAYISAMDKDDDWTNPETWKKANPSFGISVKPDDLKRKAKKAMESPAAQNAFLRLHLNCWTKQVDRWIDLKVWDENKLSEISEDELLGRRCYGGLDMSSVSDITAWVMAFPGEDDLERIDILCRFWCPEDRLRDGENRYKDQYQVWARQGYITTTPGNAVDYGFVKAQILKDAQKFQLVDMNIDRLFQGHQISMELIDEGIAVVGMGMGYISMAAPMKEFERRLLARKINHGSNPVLRWMADNVAVSSDAAGNLKPNKAESQGKIDGIVSLIMALDRASRNINVGSVYEERGLLVI